MSVPESRNLPPREGFSEAEATEVELSMDDVKDLLSSHDFISRAPRERRTSVESILARRAEAAMPEARDGERKWQTGAVVAAASIIAVAGVGYLYAFSGTPTYTPLPPAVAALDLAEPEPIVPSVKRITPVGPVVRIKNPFDRHEVFELPPGTSQNEARAKVAKVLRERAMGRLALYSANAIKKRRKSG